MFSVDTDLLEALLASPMALEIKAKREIERQEAEQQRLADIEANRDRVYELERSLAEIKSGPLTKAIEDAQAKVDQAADAVAAAKRALHDANVRVALAQRERYNLTTPIETELKELELTLRRNPLAELIDFHHWATNAAHRWSAEKFPYSDNHPWHLWPDGYMCGVRHRERIREAVSTAMRAIEQNKLWRWPAGEELTAEIARLRAPIEAVLNEPFSLLKRRTIEVQDGMWKTRPQEQIWSTREKRWMNVEEFESIPTPTNTPANGHVEL